ncbi:FAD-dependent oxidoreductase [Puia sp.]|jgi:ferredoxin-NADP reductase|uniref:ferredoxin--NADP reductase n=1 Tax=Puia sp. TaxID=2045100 RepID=UPI002F3EA540
MPQPWQTGIVIRIEQEASQTRRFYIQIPGVDSFDFEPGQFVTLDLPIHEKINKRIRSYSIASWPNGTNVIELVIVLLEGGAGTNYLFNEVTVGSELTLRGPQGIFTLPDPIEKDLFFICTGTGIAPFRSMSHHILNYNVAHREIFLIFGCRQFEDCLYRQELSELAEKIPCFHYIPTFSREKADPANPLLRTGYVHAIYEELCRADGALRPASFFLCGWKNMIDEAKQRIQALGYERKSIHQELYG